MKALSRRQFVQHGSLLVLGSALGSSILQGCGSAGTISSGADTTSGTGVGSTSCGVIPTETAGPYPADDDSSINALRLSGIVRSNIVTSLNTGAYSGSATASGLPLAITLKVVSASNSCTALAGYAVYLWHCNINGVYSMYSSGVTNETYLRGVQQTDANGNVTFNTIFPACYDGRMTHIHFEVYPSLAQAVDNNYVLKTSQLTFPMATLNSVYNNVSGYSTSKTRLAQTSYASDNVFSDGTTYQIASVTGGSYSTGYTASLQVGI